jgi:hypothetical protein
MNPLKYLVPGFNHAAEYAYNDTAQHTSEGKTVHGKLVGWMMCGLFGVAITTAHAKDNEKDASQPAKHSAVEIVTSALGLERFKDYSANQNAVGVGFADILGVEASYYDLGESKFARHQNSDSVTSENIGGRIDVKVAFDVAAPVSDRTRFYSRVGVYMWDVDMNYNRATHEFNAAQGGTSGVVGLGAAYGVEGMRLSVELEQLNNSPETVDRGRNRVLFNMSSQF